MTHVLHMRNDATYTTRDAPRFTPIIRPMAQRERVWVEHSFTEGYKNSPEMRRKVWSDYKARHVPALRECLARPDTRVLIAADPISDIGAGWIAFATGWSVDVVHWICVSMQHRKHKLMTALLDAAVTRPNVVYTHKAPVRRQQVRADLWITDLLRARGTVVSHIPYQEWSK